MTRQTDLIIIGGGLSGLAAAYELEQHGMGYTLIEVKPRLGGSIITRQTNGFVMDGGVFAFSRPVAWPTLDALGLSDALIPIQRDNLPGRSAFRQGTQALTDALAARLTGTIIRQMAVTSIGPQPNGNGYQICLENGLALEARGVIIAAAARYAERMLRSLAPGVAALLENYHYDSIMQLALGYTARNRPENPPHATPEMLFAGLHSTDAPERVPPGGLLIQAAVRTPQLSQPDRLIELLTEQMGWGTPDVTFALSWTEAAPLSIGGPSGPLHAANQQLPASVQLVGNCYRQMPFAQRTEHARQVARGVLAAVAG
jgi:protoporphyrinogen oxidase